PCGLGRSARRWQRSYDEHHISIGRGAQDGRSATPLVVISRFELPLLGSTAQRNKRQRDRGATKKGRRLTPSGPSKLPLLGSNQDSPDPESGVLPVTPRGTVLLGH